MESNKNVTINSKNQENERFINAQEYLGQNYPKGQRKNIINLNIKNKNLVGHLDLSDFTDLKKLNCDQNKITKLDVSKCNKLKEITIHGNYYLTDFLLPNNKEKLKVLDMRCLYQLPAQDLTFFREFVNLEKLSIANTNFHGSLEPLKNLTKLRELDISHTEINEGLEYLSENMELLCCCGGGGDDDNDNGRLQYQVKKIQNQLEIESPELSINNND